MRAVYSWTAGILPAVPPAASRLPLATVEEKGAVIRGFWIQPPAEMGWYSTPVTLHRIGTDAWRGSIAPLEERLSMYLLVEREKDGSLRGGFHNPEMNWSGRAAWFRVGRDAEREQLTFTDPATGKQRFAQPYDARQRRIGMEFGTPIGLTPRSRDEAVGFYPRTPASSTYVYRVPLAARDGWTTARARDVGVDEDRLRAAVEKLIAADPARRDVPRVHSLLMVRHGKLVLEEYFFGFSADRPHDLRSASKTFTSMLAGIAMDRDPSLTVDTRVDVRGITLGHLLTHSSGLACDDNDDNSPGNESTMQDQREQKDWYRYFIELPVVHPPGSTYAYCSAGMNFVGALVAKSTRMWLPDLFESAVARPLQIEHYAINLMPDGQAYSGGGIYMRPRDFLKLGQTWLGGGTWNGKRIVSKSWVTRSTAHQIATPGGGSDGFGWHRLRLVGPTRTYDGYEANGNGGQLLIVVPELDVAIAMTAGNYMQYRVWKTLREELVAKELLPALR